MTLIPPGCFIVSIRSHQSANSQIGEETMAMLRTAGVRSGERILVQVATGGVGSELIERGGYAGKVVLASRAWSG